MIFISRNAKIVSGAAPKNILGWEFYNVEKLCTKRASHMARVTYMFIKKSTKQLLLQNCRSNNIKRGKKNRTGDSGTVNSSLKRCASVAFILGQEMSQLFSSPVISSRYGLQGSENRHAQFLSFVGPYVFHHQGTWWWPR